MHFPEELSFWVLKRTNSKRFFSTMGLVLLLLQMTLNCLCQMTFEDNPVRVEMESENILDSLETSREEIQSLRDLVSKLSAEVNRQRVEQSDTVKRMETLHRKDEKQDDGDDADDHTKILIQTLTNMFTRDTTQILNESAEMRRKLEEQMQTTASLLASNSSLQQQLVELDGKRRKNEEQIDVLKEENGSLRATLTELNRLWSTTNRTEEQVNGLKSANISVQEQLQEMRTTLKEHEERITTVLQKNTILEEYIPRVLHLNSSLLDLTLSNQELRTALEFHNFTVEEQFVETVRRSREQEQRLEQTNNSCIRELKQLRFENHEQLENLSNAVELASYEATYVRWGRKVCPGNATIIYSGYIAGGNSVEQGGGNNYLCVFDRPQWGSNNKAGAQNGGSFLYGAEYEMRDGTNSPFLTSNNGGRTLFNLNPPCVLCRTLAKSQQMMIPGRTDCPPDWKFQYRGYLVTAHRSHRKMDFMCLDEAPEATSSSHRDENGATLYVVEAACGSLPCPPFVAGNEIACVVCVL